MRAVVVQHAALHARVDAGRAGRGGRLRASAATTRSKRSGSGSRSSSRLCSRLCGVCRGRQLLAARLVRGPVRPLAGRAAVLGSPAAGAGRGGGRSAALRPAAQRCGRGGHEGLLRAIACCVWARSAGSGRQDPPTGLFQVGGKYLCYLLPNTFQSQLSSFRYSFCRARNHPAQPQRWRTAQWYHKRHKRAFVLCETQQYMLCHTCCQQRELFNRRLMSRVQCAEHTPKPRLAQAVLFFTPPPLSG